jgi:putative photosynthetic complex assembly protein
MATAEADRSLPRGAVIAGFVLVGLALAAAGTARLTGFGSQSVVLAPAAASVDLVFADRADGAVVVTGAGTETVLEPGTNGFVRGVVRGLARDRRARGIGPEVPFRLVSRVDGRLALEDPATGRSLDLGAFGPTNADAFRRLLGQR